MPGKAITSARPMTMMITKGVMELEEEIRCREYYRQGQQSGKEQMALFPLAP